MDLSHFDRYPTVEELLRLPSFSCSRVCGGHAGLDRLVRGVNLTDTPDYSRCLSPPAFPLPGISRPLMLCCPRRNAADCPASALRPADICRMLCLPGWWRRQTGCPFR